MNTHRAVIESSVPPMLTLVGSGPQDFCVEQLATWISTHPLGEFEEGRVLLAVEPEVFGYVVVDRDGKAVRNFDEQAEAQTFAAEYTKDCVDAGIDWDYRVAALTALEGK